jgi:hypothetical protein
LGFVVLVGWYLVKQKPQIDAAAAPMPPIQATIEHPTAGTPAPEPEPSPWVAPVAPESAPEPASAADAATGSSEDTQTPGADV